jgi:peptidoglycan hydrolase CwlO-like protein
MKGVFKEKTVWIGAQEFGLSISVCAAPDTNLNSKINGNKTTLNNLSSQISTKNNEINKTPSGSAYYSQLIDEYNQLIKNYNSLFQETQQSISQYNQQLDSFNQCITKLKS